MTHQARDLLHLGDASDRAEVCSPSIATEILVILSFALPKLLKKEMKDGSEDFLAKLVVIAELDGKISKKGLEWKRRKML